MRNRYNFSAQEDRTSSGPLDVAKVAGEDQEEFTLPVHTSEPDETVEEERQKNRLGYTVTEPTEEEIEDGEKTPAKS